MYTQTRQSLQSRKPLSRSYWIVFMLVVMVLAACGPAAAPAEPASEPTVAALTEEPTAVPGASVPVEATPPQTAEVPQEPTAAPAEAPSAANEESVAGCPVAAEGQTLVVNEEAGYCFLIPAGYTTDYNLVVYAPETTEGHRERAIIEVAPAEGRTVSEVAFAVETEFTGFELTRSTIELGGVTAEVIDGLPGQDINRRVLAVVDDQLYTLTFMPLTPEEAPEAYAQMEELYDIMTDSFHFFTPGGTATGSETTDAAAQPQDDPILTWQGEIDGACHTLLLRPDGTTQAGVCGDAPSVTGQLLSPVVEWEAVQAHFGNIDAETNHGTITFAGSGDATDAMWADALATWASFAAMEAISGRPSAAGRTTLAWQWETTAEQSAADQPAQCNQLIVLVYGYAYANQIPCEGNGPGTLLAQGWLTDAEMTTFTTWVSNHSRVDEQAGYLDATGDAPLSAEEIDTFAADVHTRLAAGE